ncbi:NAD-dependent epimerase/dehydratase family protein [Actinomadura rudentiformis]|uniref:NAD-dependent epimerase/dehydratase family protein n=1 Tax=Actinomadura rudentiformis TaxID=359158 RepID=A0A6H9YUY3_9ACTN|nr:NAD-dependent epimerase/dehydratase family protein [Actinomadura rudentiformis]KAB2350879.1 NAD-dependent epimerase/dehydratase family protein [Actinomadura rudentiformis]
MRIVVIGATGNIGTSTIRALSKDPQVTSIRGLARRLPDWKAEKTDWAVADVRKTDLVPLLRGADAVVLLSWLFQPTHDPIATWRTNVLGSERVMRAVAEAGVPALVYSSSVGAYSPGPKNRAVDETWPTHSWPTAAYGREKAYVERLLDGFERDHPECRVVRMRPGFCFMHESAPEQRRLFAGPLLPGRLARPGLIPIVPDLPGLRFQVLHSADAGEAFRLAATKDVRGPFNIAAEPVIDPAELADLFGARVVRIPLQAARAPLAAAWSLHLVPASPQLLDLALRVPIMDTARARDELGWTPVRTAREALQEFMSGLRAGEGMETPPLSPATGGPARIREFVTGVGRKP